MSQYGHPAISYRPATAGRLCKADLYAEASWHALFCGIPALRRVETKTMYRVVNAIVDTFLRWRLENGLLTLRSDGRMVETTPAERAKMQRGK